MTLDPTQMVKDLTKELFREVIDEFVVKMSQPLVRAITVYLSADEPTTNEILQDVTQPMIK